MDFRLYVINVATNDEQGLPGSYGMASDARQAALALWSPYDAVSRITGVKLRIEIRRSDGTLWTSYETSIH